VIITIFFQKKFKWKKFFFDINAKVVLTLPKTITNDSNFYSDKGLTIVAFQGKWWITANQFEEKTGVTASIRVSFCTSSLF
jgi:hypothetical protein